MKEGTRLDAARRELGLSVARLWKRYFGLGGNATPEETARYLDGEAALPRVEHDMLTHAVNEEFMDEGMDHPIPYSEDLARGQ